MNSRLLISHSIKDLSNVIEIWRVEWLEHLERWKSDLSGVSEYDQKVQGSDKLQIGCMRSYGSLLDILSMIEGGEQGKALQGRVDAIRKDAARMQALTELWDDKALTDSIDKYICVRPFEEAIFRVKHMRSLGR
jgi:hypothetical protein